MIFALTTMLPVARRCIISLHSHRLGNYWLYSDRLPWYSYFTGGPAFGPFHRTKSAQSDCRSSHQGRQEGGKAKVTIKVGSDLDLNVAARVVGTQIGVRGEVKPEAGSAQ